MSTTKIAAVEAPASWSHWLDLHRKALATTVLTVLTIGALLATQSHAHAGWLTWVGVAAIVVGVGVITAVAVLGDGLTIGAVLITGGVLVKAGALTAVLGAVAVLADSTSPTPPPAVPAPAPVKPAGPVPANPPLGVGPTQLGQLSNPTNDALTTDTNNALTATNALLSDAQANPGKLSSDFAQLASIYAQASQDHSTIFFGHEVDAPLYTDFTQSQFDAIKADIAANGLPSEVVSDLTSVGFTAPEIQTLLNIVDNTTIQIASPSNFTTAQLLSDVPSLVPEPASLALVGAGLAGMALVRRRKRAWCRKVTYGGLGIMSTQAVTKKDIAFSVIHLSKI